MRSPDIRLSEKAIKDIKRLKKENSKLGSKLWELIISILDTPFEGIGKPEALKGDMSGWWSRRITDKHRLIYRVKDDRVDIVSCYGHYDDK